MRDPRRTVPVRREERLSGPAPDTNTDTTEAMGSGSVSSGLLSTIST